MYSLVNDLVVICDETEDIPNSSSINLSNKISYWLIAVVLLATLCLLLLATIFVKWYVKRGLTTP